MNAKIKFLASAIAPAIVMGACLLSSPTSAAVFTTNMGTLDPPDSGFFDALVIGKGAFEDIGTFDLTAAALTDVAAHIGANFPAIYTPGALSLFEGTPALPGALIDTQTLTFDSSTKEYVAGFNDIKLGPDPYFAEINGTSNVIALGVSGSVTTGGIPELSTWAMLGIGLAGIGLVGVTKRRASRFAL
jgi:hypothetical protein